MSQSNDIRVIQKTMDAIESAFDRMNNPHRYEAGCSCPQCGGYSDCVRVMESTSRKPVFIRLYKCPNGHTFKRYQAQGED